MVIIYWLMIENISSRLGRYLSLWTNSSCLHLIPRQSRRHVRASHPSSHHLIPALFCFEALLVVFECSLVIGWTLSSFRSFWVIFFDPALNASSRHLRSTSLSCSFQSRTIFRLRIPSFESSHNQSFRIFFSISFSMCTKKWAHNRKLLQFIPSCTGWNHMLIVGEMLLLMLFARHFYCRQPSDDDTEQPKELTIADNDDELQPTSKTTPRLTSVIYKVATSSPLFIMHTI